MRKLFALIGDPKTSLPIDFRGLRNNTQAKIKWDLNHLKAAVRENYLGIVEKLKLYEESYRQFIAENRPGPFREFLGQAHMHYLDLAACLSRNSHAINLVQDQQSRTGSRRRVH